MNAWMNEVANQRVHGSTKRIPFEVWQEQEKAVLQPLPTQRYEFFHVEERKVNGFGHVTYRNNYYSVPHTLVGQVLHLHSNGTILRISQVQENGLQEVALHFICQHDKGQYITIDEHLSPCKQRRSDAYFVQEMEQKIGVQGLAFMQQLQKEDVGHWRDKIRGVLSLCKFHDQNTLERACAMALENQLFSYVSVRDICRQIQVQAAAQLESTPSLSRPIFCLFPAVIKVLLMTWSDTTSSFNKCNKRKFQSSLNHLTMQVPNQQQQLENKLKYLRMSAVLQSLDQHNEVAQQQQLSYLEFFEMLIEEECVKRKANVLKGQLSKSKLNLQKSFEQYDFNFQPEVDRKLIAQIRTCRFIDEFKNIILIGKPGTGKTHLANAIGLDAAAKGYSVLFVHLHSLLERLAQGRIDSSHRRIFQQVIAPDLLILDEIGFRALAPLALDDFFEIIRHRYERKATIFTSNRNFEDWGAILGDKVMASAIIDRMVHHAHIIKFNGDSFRIKDFLAQEKISG